MKDDRIYLEHILESADKIIDYTRGGREDFMRNPMAQDAVIRNFEIIGEAAKQLSDDFCKMHPDIPWNDMARFRDVLIHHYMGISLTEVWNVVESHLPSLRAVITRTLNR
ncbi:MAG: DUF86 domain-containing protein [Sedimentisphaerales bacterium]|nr:DUF86 domain-containing protein [Sedimentisphaerales bacterium]